MASSTNLERATGELATRVASGMTRRSFLGKVTRVAIVMAGAGVGIDVFAAPALALTCSCSGRRCDAGCTGDRQITCGETGHSVTCVGLTGHLKCPSCTTACGTWTCSCPGTCPSGTKIWTDCCANCNQCGSQSSCRCVTDYDHVTRPTCCYKKCYSDEGSNCSHFIVCRWGECL